MKDRQAPCIYYKAKGDCAKNMTDGADMSGKCRTCRKYVPRKGFKTVDKKAEAKRRGPAE